MKKAEDELAENQDSALAAEAADGLIVDNSAPESEVQEIAELDRTEEDSASDAVLSSCREEPEAGVSVQEEGVLEDEAATAEAGEEEELEEEEGFQLPLRQVVEAILFAADEPVGIDKIARAAGSRIRREAVREAIEQLQEEYLQAERAFEIVEVAEKFQMLTRAEFARNVQVLYGKRAVKEEREKKLSPAALDTLAIIAYKQPVTRAEVEAVRGVGCGQVMRQLMERGSIKPVGKRMDVLGYPLLYGTTDLFLREFGLASLDVLPMAAELRRLTKVELPTPEVIVGADADSATEVEDEAIESSSDDEVLASDVEDRDEETVLGSGVEADRDNSEPETREGG